MADRLIRNTREPVRHPWPDDCMVQGGDRGVVFGSSGTYRTAFVEAFPAGTFLRGEGATIAEAEDVCWVKYQVLSGCAHDQGFDRRDYVNGSGFCRRCGTWFGRSVTGFDPLPEYYAPPKNPTLLDRVFGGDADALRETLNAVVHVDDLPEKGNADA